MKHTKKITILHSNDLHGDFLAEEVDKKLVGGVSMLSGYIEKVRAEEPNTLYAIAGDMFRGSVIDSEYKGLSTIEIMNALAPDIVTIGNHEVDYGIAHLLFIEKCAKFPIINANLYIKNTQTRLFTPYDRTKGDFDYFTYCGKEVGKEIADTAIFTVGMQNYHFQNIESFLNISHKTLAQLQKPRSVATSCQDILLEYFREHEWLDAKVDGRMEIIGHGAA